GLARDTNQQTPHRCRSLLTHRVATSPAFLSGSPLVLRAPFLPESGQSLGEIMSWSCSFFVSIRCASFSPLYHSTFTRIRQQSPLWSPGGGGQAHRVSTSRSLQMTCAVGDRKATS